MNRENKKSEQGSDPKPKREAERGLNEDEQKQITNQEAEDEIVRKQKSSSSSDKPTKRNPTNAPAESEQTNN